MDFLSKSTWSGMASVSNLRLSRVLPECDVMLNVCYGVHGESF